MKILSYNVNGIRASLSKDLLGYLQSANADVVCLQEIKATPDQIDPDAFGPLGYHCQWFPAQKKGYSGVAILSRKKPLAVHEGCGHELFDAEGRVLRCDFEEGSVISAYFPSGTSGDERQGVKYEFLEHFQKHCESLMAQGVKRLAVAGDYNICHQAIDIHDPVSNKNSTGFLPEERAWMDQWFGLGMVDSFRHLHPEPHRYTWWSYRAGARSKNKGWRIDYISLSPDWAQDLRSSGIDDFAVHSDHCPLWAVLDQ
jgi:exodeoxyribonuclease-3